MFENRNGVLDFPPEVNLVMLIAELINKIVKLFNMVCFNWYRRSLNLFEKFLKSLGKVLEFHIQLTVATLY